MKKIPLFIFDFIMKIITVFVFILSLLCVILPNISPNTIGYIQLIGLFAPLIYLINIIFLLIWTIRLKLFAIVPIIGLIISINGIGRVFQLNFAQKSNISSTGINVMSYNVMGFLDEKYNSHAEQTLKDIKKQKIDILCFQEFSTISKYSFSKINAQIPNLKYNKVLYSKRYAKDYGWGMAIYSAYPIIKRKDILFENSDNAAMYVDIRIKKDTIRVFNLHLQTTSITNDERLLLSDKSLIASLGVQKEVDKVKNIGRKLKQANLLRAKQAEIIKEEIDNSPYKVIVCGDFNDTPVSYTYQTIKGDLKDSFVKKGRGYGHTFNHFLSLLRIDYIMYSKGLKALDYNTFESKWSDHNPVIVKLEISQ